MMTTYEPDADPDFNPSAEDNLENTSKRKSTEKLNAESISSTISGMQKQNLDISSLPGPSTSNKSDVKKIPVEKDQKLTRKRKRQPEKWKKNVLKKARKSGLQYTNKKGKVFRPKEVRNKLCSGKCPYKCPNIIIRQNQEDIHLHFWSLTDDQKKCILQ